MVFKYHPAGVAKLVNNFTNLYKIAAGPTENRFGPVRFDPNIDNLDLAPRNDLLAGAYQSNRRATLTFDFKVLRM